MKLKHLLAPTALIALCLHAGASFAVGNITGVSAPTNAAAGSNVNVTVQGNGVCPLGIKVQFGDGSVHNSPAGVTLPYAVPAHVYATGGNKTVTALKQDSEDGDCFGTANDSVNVYKLNGIYVTDTTPKKGVAIKAHFPGAGTCPSLQVDWGDGNNSTFNSYNMSTHPLKPHTYNSNGYKTIEATCGSFTKTKQVNVSDSGGTVGPWVPTDKLAPKQKFFPANKLIFGAKIEGTIGNASSMVNAYYKLKITGKGVCKKLRIAWGDGAYTDKLNYNLASPSYVSHKYTTTGYKHIIVAPKEATCKGGAYKKVKVNALIIKPGVLPKPKYRFK